MPVKPTMNRDRRERPVPKIRASRFSYATIELMNPRVALPSEIDSLPDRPAVFLLWAAEGPTLSRPHHAASPPPPPPHLRPRPRLPRLKSPRHRRTHRILAHRLAARIDPDPSRTRPPPFSPKTGPESPAFARP